MDLQDYASDLEDYSKKLALRAEQLDSNSNKSLIEMASLNESQNDLSKITKNSLFSLKKDLELIKDNLEVEIKNILKLVDQFKNSLDKAKFAALKQRVDVFKGEQLVSREEFKRWLKKELE